MTPEERAVIEVAEVLRDQSEAFVPLDRYHPVNVKIGGGILRLTLEEGELHVHGSADDLGVSLKVTPRVSNALLIGFNC